jgi:glucose-6-phosphate isomerase
MSKEQPNHRHFFDLLQKYNNNQPTLSARLSSETGRFERFSRQTEGLLVDFSRTGIGEQAFATLMDLAGAAGVEAERDRMFAGAELNFTEHRPVLHPLWRSQNFADLLDPQEAALLKDATQRLRDIAGALHGGRLPGAGDAVAIRHIVHVGIGGSLLGPRLLCEAFPPGAEGPRIHFLSSVDALDRARLLQRIDPRETAVILVSKSFTTSEVLLHAERIRDWQLGAMDREAANRRLFAVTAAAGKAEKFGVPPEHVLQMGEWTGGRFSVWSPVGVTGAVAMGPDAFDDLLAGGASMDRHFREAPLSENLPVILAMLAVWHHNVCGYDVHGLIPYDSRLAGLPAWLQQVEMESNGKSVDTDGQTVALATAPVVMGDTGTDAQHALFQAFHQGTTVVPLDFIGVIQPDHADGEAQQQLLSHMLAQATALAVGRSTEQTRALMRQQGVPEAELESLLPHRMMPGDRPSIVLLLDRLTPANLGRLLVLYEHMVFVESVVWRINAFDQWGVELGKILASGIQPALSKEGADVPEDIPGLTGLVGHIRKTLS